MANRAERLPEPMSSDDFIQWMATWSDMEKWELYEGVPVAMAGGTRAHSHIASNITFALRPLRNRGCREYRDALVRSTERSDFAAFPDVFVRCGPLDDTKSWSDDPTLVFEILSPSTMKIDRGYKLLQYMAFPTLRHYVIVYPTEFRVEMWSRDAGGAWIDDPTVLRSLSETLVMPEFDLAIPMREIYADTELALAAAG
jgi:Uma2 family endonuclease